MELKLAFPGGTYEEERTATHDAAGRTLAATYAAAGEKVELERRGGRMQGTRRVGDETSPIDVAVSDDALAGMGFVLAADMPFEVGATRPFTDYNEAQGLLREGEASFTVVGTERLGVEGTAIETWKVVLRRADGRELPLWIDGERKIVRVDWGGGNQMVIRPGPTRHLFRPG